MKLPPPTADEAVASPAGRFGGRASGSARMPAVAWAARSACNSAGGLAVLDCLRCLAVDCVRT